METIIYKDHEINIKHDNYPENIIEQWECWSSRIITFSDYNIGHKHSYKNRIEFLSDLAGINSDDPDHLLNIAEKKGILILPVYIYDHSGITINTTGFNCRWDSGQIGYVYTDTSLMRDMGHNWKRWTESRKQVAKKWMICDVKLIDNYITGEVYGYTIDEEGDSYWGFFGSGYNESGLLGDAKNRIDYIVDNKLKTA